MFWGNPMLSIQFRAGLRGSKPGSIQTGWMCDFKIIVHGRTTKCAGQPRTGPSALSASDFLGPESGPEILHHFLTRSQFWA